LVTWFSEHPEARPWPPEFDAGVCSVCQIAERVNALTAEDREAIRVAATQGVVPAVKEMYVRLGWSIKDAAMAVELLRHLFDAAAHSRPDHHAD
jgi:hypothetical protein